MFCCCDVVVALLSSAGGGERLPWHSSAPSLPLQVTGSHDHSLRLWERTDEPLILSEERENEREAEFEEAAVKDGEPVVSVCRG